MSTSSYSNSYSYSSPWMQQHNYPQACNASSDPAYQYQQTNTLPPNWQLYDDGVYASQPVNQQTHSPHSDFRLHRRQNSNSTSASYVSIRSPYTHATPLPHSTAFDNTYLDPSCDYSGAAQYQKHLPTPIHTPTPQDYMEIHRGYNRRASGTMASQKNARQSNNGVSMPEEIPHTPRTSNGDQTEEQYHVPNSGEAQDDFSIPQLRRQDSYLSGSASRRVPTFDRTMSAIYQDELYDPAAIVSAPAPVGKNTQLLSPYRQIVNDRLHAANEARSARTAGERLSRDPSPFRQGSPFAGQNHGYGPIGTAAGARQQQKAEADALAYQQHHPPPDITQPNTISPKDAVLDYHEQPEDSIQGPPLFPQTSNTSDGSNYDNNARGGYGPVVANRQQAPSNYPPVTPFSFPTPTVPASTQSQNAGDFKFNAPAYRPAPSDDSQDQGDYPAHLVSMETTKSEPDGESQSYDGDIERPAHMSADGGTYTCTYHGCSQRFASPAMLQKHKREGHRASLSDPSLAPPQPQSPGTPNSSAAAQLRNSQAGPHKCERINPSTGKPCNTIFSRPYDLTRHEDTIHAQRTKVRCQYCTEEKTFSRSDALTRHMRVVHPNIDFPGKHKRRHMD